MVWSLLYDLTRNSLGVMLLRFRGDAAKDIEILVLHHQLAVLRGEPPWPSSPPTGSYWPRCRGCRPEPARTLSW
jgi:putative transposase